MNKKEFRPLAGAIKDISWTGDNQRIAVGGEGRERYIYLLKNSVRWLEI